jgi:insulysin
MPQLQQSASDKRVYRLLTLDNKLRCLLISDSEADMAAAALDVHVGSSLDPRNAYGVAHFLEHMLF